MPAPKLFLAFKHCQNLCIVDLSIKELDEVYSMTHMSIGWGSDMGHLQLLCYLIWEFLLQLLAKSRFPIEVACLKRDLMCGAFTVPKDNFLVIRLMGQLTIGPILHSD